MSNVEKFKRYYKVQMSGSFNMITQADHAAYEAGLSIEDYFDVIRHYDEYKKEFQNSEEK